MVEIEWITSQQERDFFDREARRLLGISGDEFRQRLAAGEYEEIIDDPDHHDLMYLALLSRAGR